MAIAPRKIFCPSKQFYLEVTRKAFFHRKVESSFFHFNLELLAKLFDLIYYILTPTLILILQLSLNPIPHIKCARMNISQCSFSLCKIIFSGEIVTPKFLLHFNWHERNN